ncbi:hypothetical protein N7501_004456 [Penicillium viridicatum]|nr:hypothetical protein N7501_004456 [Penicillium viridicatum]
MSAAIPDPETPFCIVLQKDNELFIANTGESQLTHSGSVKPKLGVLRLSAHTEPTIDNWGDLGLWTWLGDLMPFKQILEGPWELQGVAYDIDNGTIGNPVPIVLGSQISSNDTDVPQTPSLNLTYQVAETSSFSNTTGVSLEVGATFEAGVPFVAEGKIETKITAETEFTWGQSKTTTVTVGEQVPVNTPPHSRIRAKASMTTSTMDVPCIFQLRSAIDPTVKAHTTGSYSGLTYWDFRVDYEQL